MGFLFSVIFATILVSGQHMLAEARIDGYPQWKGMFEPLVSDWNSLDQEKYPWNNREDPYLYENTIDGTDYSGKEYNDDPDIRYFIITAKPQPAPRTLSDLLRYNKLDEILSGTARIPDNSGFTQSSQPLNVLSPAINDISKPSSRENNNNINLIPSALIASRPFRLSTLASIGYGPNFRFYR